MFELFCRYLMHRNGYSLIPHDGVKVVYPDHGRSKYNIKMQGRGTNHQIDLPFDYDNDIPMVNPIRVIGEVKYYNKPIGISAIRDFFGVLEDINQNHFYATGYRTTNRKYRKLEQGLFISASGFTKGAQSFALAHNIKLLSPGSSRFIRNIKNGIDRISESVYFLLETNQIEQDSVISLLKFLFNNIVYRMDELTFNGLHNQRNIPRILLNAIEEDMETLLSDSILETMILGSTTSGHLLLFVSDEPFPVQLFRFTDSIDVAIYYDYLEETNEVDETIKLKIPMNQRMYTMYTSVPKEILIGIQQEHEQYNNAIRLKHIIFNKIIINMEIYEQQRIIKLRFNEQLTRELLD